MATAGLKEFQFNAFYGLNTTNDPTNVGTYEATAIRNWLIRTSGQLIRRNGATLVGDDTGSNKILGLTHFVSGSTKYQIRVEATTVKYLNGSTWDACSGAGATGLTTGLEMNFAAANGFVYGFNGTDDVRKINGTTVTTVVAIPKGKFAVWYRNYLFVGGVSSYPNRLYFSNLNDPETFSANDYIDVEPGDGDELTGIISNQADKIIVAKKKSVHYLSGAGTNTFAVFPITRDFGFVNYRSMVSVGSDVWGVTPDARVMSVFKSQYGLMGGRDMSSDFIKGTMNGLNTAYLNVSAAFYFDGYIGFAVPNASSTVNNLVLVYDLLANIPNNRSRWTTFTGWTPSVFDVHYPSDVPILFWGEANADSKVYKWSGNTDNGTVIDASWTSKDNQFESLGQPKRFAQIKAFATSLGSYNVLFESSIDNNSYSTLGNLNLTPLTSTWNGGLWNSLLWGDSAQVEERFHFSNNYGKVYGKKAQIRISYNANSASPAVSSFSLYYVLRRWR